MLRDTYRYHKKEITPNLWIRINVHTSVADSDPNPETDQSNPHVLGLLDPDPDPPVRGMDPDPEQDPYPDHSIIMQQ
jgi:hypothetical protein